MKIFDALHDVLSVVVGIRWPTGSHELPCAVWPEVALSIEEHTGASASVMRSVASASLQSYVPVCL